MNIENLKQLEREYKIRFYMGFVATIILLAICIYNFITNTEFAIISLLPLAYTIVSTKFIYVDWVETSCIIKQYNKGT